MITQQRLKEIAIYDPVTGIMNWKNHKRNGCGQLGSINKSDGYVQVRIGKTMYRVHVLAFIYMTGAPPKVEVDHDNRVRSDNRWDNLKDATRRENMLNLPIRCDNTSGYPGVYRKKDKWRAAVYEYGKEISLGYFIHKDDAIAARKTAEALYYYGASK